MGKAKLDPKIFRPMHPPGQGVVKAGPLTFYLADNNQPLVGYKTRALNMPLVESGYMLTLPNYCKWYGLYLVDMATDMVYGVDWAEIDEAYQKLNWRDHVPTKEFCIEILRILRAMLDDVWWDQQTIEMIAGRIRMEHDHDDWETPETTN